MTPRRFCLLGGGGFIGTNLALRLVREGHTVKIFGRPPRHLTQLAGVTIAEGNFSDVDLLRRAVNGSDVVFHLISSSNAVTAESHRAEALLADVRDTLALLDLGTASLYGRLVFVSSGGTVYGPQQSYVIPETASEWPISSYGVAKLTIERCIHVYGHLENIDYRIARVSNPYGPFQALKSGQGLIAAVLSKAATRLPVTIVGDGEAVRDYVYIDDVVEALEKLSGHAGAGRVFNVGSGVGQTVNAVVDEVERALSVTAEKINVAPRGFDVPRNVLDISRARSELGWTPQVEFADGIARTTAWFLQELGDPESA